MKLKINYATFREPLNLAEIRSNLYNPAKMPQQGELFLVDYHGVPALRYEKKVKGGDSNIQYISTELLRTWTFDDNVKAARAVEKKKLEQAKEAPLRSGDSL